jgi:hypothetical protein
MLKNQALIMFHLAIFRSNSDETIIGNNNPAGRVHHQSHHPVIIRPRPLIAQHQADPNDDLADAKEQILASFRDQMRARYANLGFAFRKVNGEIQKIAGGDFWKWTVSSLAWECSRTGTI